MTPSHRFAWWSAVGWPRIGQVLVDLAFMDEDQLWDVLEEARASGERTGAAAVRLGLLTPEELRQALAEQRRRREQGPA